MTKQKRICTADFETDPFKKGRVPKVFGVGFYDGEKYHEWFEDNSECVEYFVDWIDTWDQEEKDNTIIYFHNGGGFDFNYLLKYADFTYMMVLHGDIAKFTIKGVEFRDSLLLLPMSLSKYKKGEIDYAIFEKELRWLPENFEKIREYQKLDCIYLHEWVSKFIDQFGLHLTLPSASFQQLKESGYKVQRSRRYYDKQYRDFYYGGRTEVKQPGRHKGDIIYQDLNSAYPDVMQMAHPYGTRVFIDPNPQDIPTAANYFAVIDAVSKGALPFREENGHLSFPSDNQVRRYSVTGWEIQAGLDTGTLDIKDVVEVRIHQETRNFKAFVDKWYQIKLDAEARGDTDMRTFAKLILNACYGRFALDAFRYKKYTLTLQGLLPDELTQLYIHYGVNNVDALYQAVCYDDDIEDYEADERTLVTTWEPLRDLDGLTIWQRADPQDRFYNTATAASITGAVRAKLWRTICECEDWIYCDTDSIMCRQFNGPESDQLGDWSLECVFDDLFIGGKKLYAGHIKDTPYINERMFNRMKEKKQAQYLKTAWKKASKGSQLTPYQIKDIVIHKKQIKWENMAPSFSLRYGDRFIDRIIQMTV